MEHPESQEASYSIEYSNCSHCQGHVIPFCEILIRQVGYWSHSWAPGIIGQQHPLDYSVSNWAKVTLTQFVCDTFLFLFFYYSLCIQGSQTCCLIICLKILPWRYQADGSVRFPGLFPHRLERWTLHSLFSSPVLQEFSKNYHEWFRNHLHYLFPPGPCNLIHLTLETRIH